MALIMVADDESAALDLAVYTLEMAGHEVIGALSARAALAALDRRPDLVITDLRMPLMSGIDLARCLRADRATAGIPILMVTAFDPGQVDDSLIDRHMSKPFTPQGLRRC